MEHFSEIAKFTLMLELPWYEYRFYISLLVGTLITLLVPSSNKLVYLVLFNIFAIVTYFAIDFMASQKINQDKLTELINRCQSENNVKKEHFLNKLKNLTFENPTNKPGHVLDEKEDNYFNERGSVSLETTEHAKRCNVNLASSPKRPKDTHIEKFANPYPTYPQQSPYDPQIAGDFIDNVSINSFKNDPAAFESTYQMIQTPPIPTPPPQVGPEGCLLGKDNCNPICSGNNKNECQLQTSIPGPQWQPQKASSVQNRLNNGDFVPNYCPL